jgi:aminoglycoside phosphotransferase (APT) family kinase protein
MPTLEEYAAALGRPREVLVLRSGQGSDVVIDAREGQVWRIPRSAAARRRVAGDRARLRCARSLGLLAPEVLSSAGMPDRDHILMRFVPGIGLDRGLVLDEPAAQRLAGDLAALVGRLRRAPLDSWPAVDAVPWGERWVIMASRVNDLLLPRLSSRSAARARLEMQTAVAAARDAPVTSTHGDLGGDNIRVNPGTGQLAGVLDWDGAGPGDPAVDLAALRASLPAVVWDLVLARLRPTPVDLGRAAAYAATFGLQEVLLGAEQGDEQAIQSGLSAYQ